ncbi:cellular retinoic acid-binding protein 1-like isoform X2 [Penaeus monodon]|uniref:cellular retinoic acid-binding protein 1-like isoform X2 n=1 Tax=Penaeus monodon TaxID=6687 RepID=UPI0018A7C8EC|nr:cellular retinoic acid-binding protein 1-like isoform X2 [Penaeus monodon]
MVQFEGRFQHERSENFDEFLKAIGVPLIPRKMVVASNPVVEVRRDGDTWTIRMNTLVRTVEYVFEPGQTVETETMGGMAQNVFTIEDDKIMQTQKSDTYTTEVIRQFTEDSLIMTITHVESGIICHRYFRRL